MSKIVAAKAYTNNEVAFIAWTLKEPISDCLGFELTRIYLDETHEERPLAAWVSFKGQANPSNEPQTTSVWPVQKMSWRDLTLRRRRNEVELRPTNVKVKYRIRPLVKRTVGLEPVTNIPAEKTYEGDPLPLSYFDEGIFTNDILVTSEYGKVRAAFTNGILSAQWLRTALEEELNGKPLTVDVVLKHIDKPGDKIRQYLTGDVLDMVQELIKKASHQTKAKVRLALYELADKELCDLIFANQKHLQLILANTAKDDKTKEWDTENKPIRDKLQAAHSDIHHRMFNNGHIGHNKFAIFVGSNGKPKAVMTGSTNWTRTGLCAQTNNAMIIDSAEVAQDYADYWDRLLTDTGLFEAPVPPFSKTTKNAQGKVIRAANAKAPKVHTLTDGTKVTIWFSPNTVAKTKKDVLPPDLAAVFALMENPLNKAIFFACFLPSQSGKSSIIAEAIAQGEKHPDMLVYGAVSDPRAMPNYIPPPKKVAGVATPPAKPRPATYDKGNIHVVRAAALIKSDIVGDFESELKSAGHAIIHDKIVVIDPLGENAALIMGSHNLGYKASYENDENLIIIQGNKRLIEAYAVHILDLYDHYRFRAVQYDMAQRGQDLWDGFLDEDGKWLETQVKTKKGNLARYFAGG